MGDEPAEPSQERARLAWYAAVARWAPSKHNTQPWRFVVREGCLEFWSDPGRGLPDTDPDGRELAIACGTAVHLACTAARALGREPHVTLLPDRDRALLARLVEIGPWFTTQHDRAVLAAAPRRRTDRGPLDGDRLPTNLAFLLETAAAHEGATLRLVGTPADRCALAGLVARADRLLAEHGLVDRELARWLRDAGDRRADGVPADHTRGAEASRRAEFVQRDFSGMWSRPSQARDGLDRPLVGVLCTAQDLPADWLVAGQALGAVLLHATAAGANASFLNQPVEEPAVRVELSDSLQLPGVAQVVLRIGVGGQVTPTPRRCLRDVLVRADTGGTAAQLVRPTAGLSTT